jgi:hypothetical protein
MQGRHHGHRQLQASFIVMSPSAVVKKVLDTTAQAWRVAQCLRPESSAAR